jgi:hypothetical protein
MKSDYQNLFRVLIFTSILCLLPTKPVLGAWVYADLSIPKSQLLLLNENHLIPVSGEAQKNILLGEPLDEDGPLTTNTSGDPNPVEVNQPLDISATVDDRYYGGSPILSAQYSLDNGIQWLPLSAVDGKFDQVSEQVQATTQAPAAAGNFSLCVRGTDINGNTGMSACASLAVYLPDVQGPQIIDLKLDPNPALTGQSVTLSAAISDQTTGGSLISGAEYSQDNGVNWQPLAAADGDFDDVIEQVSVGVQAPMTAINATYCVRGTDELGNTGQKSCITLGVYAPDQAGPSTINLVADPNPQEVSQELSISAVVDDRFTGNSPIQSAEYSLDNGVSWHAMLVVDGAWDESVEGVWAQAIAPDPAGSYELCVRGRDSNDDTGPKTCLSLLTITRDNQGPLCSAVSAAPNPVEVRAQLTLAAAVDETSTGGTLIQSAQYSLDNGTSWSEMNPQDGAFDAVQENVIVNITSPYEAGVYDLCVRGIDQNANIGESECIPITVYASTAQKEFGNHISIPLIMVNFQH